MSEAGAGPKPVPHKELTVDKLADGIKFLLTDDARKAAEKIAGDIKNEGDGSKNAVTSFHRSLILRGEHSMRCSILEDRVAVWTLKGTSLRLSALAAGLLVEKKKITWKQLRLIRHNEWNDFEGPGEPLSGGATAIMGTVTGIATGVGSVPFKIAKSSKRRARHDRKKRRKSEQLSRKSMDVDHGKNGAGQTNGTTEELKIINRTSMNGNDNAQVNGRPRGQENQFPNDAGIPASKAPSTGMEKVTSGPDLGKHSQMGEPMSQKRDAQNEAQHEHDDDAVSELSDDPEDNVAVETGKNVGSGIAKTAEYIARAPMDLTLAIAQGFHNAPRLYGDETVRRQGWIDSLHQGSELTVLQTYSNHRHQIRPQSRGRRVRTRHL